MKTLLLTIGLMATTSAIAQPTVESVCSDVGEVTYASYLNAQDGTTKAVTLDRMMDIYVGDHDMIEFMEVFINLAYSVPKPPVSMSAVQAAKVVRVKAEVACQNQLNKAVEQILEEESNKVGM